jgi:hypothetical protein
MLLGVDVWEGNPQIDEAVLKAAGVEFMVVRLNDMNGGHHKDTNFDSQWLEAQEFIRWPYFVYNPWISGVQNFTWLQQNMPDGAKAVSLDIEVVKSGYSPAEYASQVSTFLGLVKQLWNFNIYTGQWFLPNLSTWPTKYEYWWARYPFSVYPAARTNIDWDGLKAKLGVLAWSPGTTPGICRLWQCSADRYILPGCGGSSVDINLWSGTREELVAWAGNSIIPPQTWQKAVTAFLRGQGYTGPDIV